MGIEKQVGINIIMDHHCYHRFSRETFRTEFYVIAIIPSLVTAHIHLMDI